MSYTDEEIHHAPSVSRGPDTVASKNTTLLPIDVTAPFEPAPPQHNRWFNRQTLSGLSVLICLGLSLTAWLISAALDQARWSGWPPAYLYHPARETAQLFFWLSFPSLLNYVCLKRSKRDLPWLINAPIDFSIAIASAASAPWYIMRIISIPDEGRWRCEGNGYSKPTYDKERCAEVIETIKSIGAVAMGFLLLLALTHAALFWIRVFKTPGPSINWMAWRDEGWFAGVGKGPLGVRVLSNEQSVREQTDNLIEIEGQEDRNAV